MNRIGLLIIATNKYEIFIEPLLRSVEKYFFKKEPVDIYLFVDKKYHGLHLSRLNIVQIPIEHKPFPYATLYRYKYFSTFRQLITSQYIFYLDVDMRIVAPIGEEILPTDCSLVGTIHPGFYKGGGSWCVDEKSNAFTPYYDRKKYYAGGFNGGTNEAFLTMSRVLSEAITEDESRGVMAEWHDESFLNKWFNMLKCKELSPSYCYPESWKLPFPKKILALDKNHSEIRS